MTEYQNGQSIPITEIQKRSHRHKKRITAPIKWTIFAVIVVILGVFTAHFSRTNASKPEKTIAMSRQAVNQKHSTYSNGDHAEMIANEKDTGKAVNNASTGPVATDASAAVNPIQKEAASPVNSNAENNKDKSKVTLPVKENEAKAKQPAQPASSNVKSAASIVKPKGFTYKTYFNTRFGFSVQYPDSFTEGPAPTNNDGRYFRNTDCKITAYGSHINILSNNETIDTYYKQAQSKAPGPIAYQKEADHWYVISYKNGSNIIYEKAVIQDNCIFTVNIIYPASQQAKYGPMVTHIANTFKAGHSD